MFKKIISIIVLLAFTLNIFTWSIIYADNGLNDLDALLNDTYPFTEIETNINVWQQYAREIVEISPSFYNKLVRFTNKLINKYAPNDIWEILGSILWWNNLKNLKENLNTYKKRYDNLVKIKTKLVNIVLKRWYKKNSIYYKVLWYIYYRILSRQKELEKDIENLKIKIKELESGYNDDLDSLLWSIAIDEQTWSNQTTKSTNNNITNKSIYFGYKKNQTIDNDTEEINVGKFVISWSFIDYYWKENGLDTPIKVLKCRLVDISWDTPDGYIAPSIIGWYLKWPSYNPRRTGTPDIFTKLYVTTGEDWWWYTTYVLYVKQRPIEITNNMKLVLNLGDKWVWDFGLDCKFIYSHIWNNNTKNINLDKWIFIFYHRNGHYYDPIIEDSNDYTGHQIHKGRNDLISADIKIKTWYEINLKSIKFTTWGNINFDSYSVKINWKLYNDIQNINTTLTSGKEYHIVILWLLNKKPCKNRKFNIRINSLIYTDTKTWKKHTYNMSFITKNNLFYIGTDCKIPNRTITWNIETWNVAYCLKISYPSAYIYSSYDKVFLYKYIKEGNKWKGEKIKEIWTFTNKPNLYTVEIKKWRRICRWGFFHRMCYYKTNDKPKKWYIRWTIYKWTNFEWLTESCMFASSSLEGLKNKLKNWWEWKIPTNSHGWNLNRDDNYWTIFKFKSNIVNIISK